MQETLEAYKLSICLVWGSQSIKTGGVAAAVVAVVVGKRREGWGGGTINSCTVTA